MSDQPQESLISDEMRAQIGVERRTQTGEVIGRDIGRYCAAVGDLNPIYLDDEAARGAGYEGVIAPPLFFQYAIEGPPVRLDQLRPDGIPQSPSESRVKLPLPRIMAGGVDVEFFEPIRPGDTLTATPKIIDIYERRGRTGPMVFQVVETTYRNQRGEVVVIERNTRINR
jgi:acyl dehydratase